MDVKEKLVELLGRVQQMGVIYRENQMDERYPTIEQIRNTEVAARLIANGVTVQEWISVKDRPPEMPPDKIAEGYVQMQVLVWCDKGRQCAWFQVDTKTFYDQPGLFGTEVDGVTHWMPLPEPPQK